MFMKSLLGIRIGGITIIVLVSIVMGRSNWYPKLAFSIKIPTSMALMMNLCLVLLASISAWRLIKNKIPFFHLIRILIMNPFSRGQRKVYLTLKKKKFSLLLTYRRNRKRVRECLKRKRRIWSRIVTQSRMQHPIEKTQARNWTIWWAFWTKYRNKKSLSKILKWLNFKKPTIRTVSKM